MYNNRHWLTDVAAGAGIGILSTKIAYWINPYITNTLFGGEKTKAVTIIVPSYDGRTFGIAFSSTF